jgi:hypothetical protein
VHDPVLAARHILKMGVPIDVDEDDSARSISRSSQRCIDAKIDVEAREDLAMIMSLLK